MEDNCYRGQATQAALKFFRKKKKKENTERNEKLIVQSSFLILQYKLAEVKSFFKVGTSLKLQSGLAVKFVR